MRILYLCCDPGIPAFGRKGASSHVRGTCVALADQGHDVHLVCADAGGDLEGRGKFRVTEVRGPTARPLGFDLRRIGLDRRFERAVNRILAGGWRPEAIYERYSLYSLTGTRLARRLKLPHILEINAFLSEELAGRLRMPPLARRYEKRVICAARDIFVVSQPLKEGVETICSHPPPVAIEPMSVDVELCSDRVDGAPVRAELGLADKFIIGYVGTLAGWHGIRLFYEIADELRRRGIEDFVILVVGGEEDKLDKHRGLARERNLEAFVRFHGAVPHAVVPAYLRAMDIGLIPDANPWNAPTKLFEYQACGIPPVGPDYPGVRASLEDGVEGFIFPPRDVPTMVDRIEQLYRDPDLRRSMGARSRERVARTRSWTLAAHKIVACFEAQRGSVSDPRPS